MSRSVKLTLELKTQVKRLKHVHGTDLDVISRHHSGDIVVKMVGSSKMSDNMWGDTVPITNGILPKGKHSVGSILVS